MRFFSAFVLLCVSIPSARGATGPDRVATATMPAQRAADPGLQRGVVSHTVPFELPPAAGGMVPELALVLDIAATNGTVGASWQLAGFSRIERTSLNGGVPSYDADPESSVDIFLLDGVRLWDTSVDLPSGAWSNVWSAVAWSPEVYDGRLVDFDAAANVWRVRQNGWTWEYGDDVALSAAHERVTERATGDLLNDGSRTSAWLLHTATDPFGNTVTYEYSALPAGLAPPTLDDDGSTAVLDDEYAVTHVPTSISFGGATPAAVTLTWEAREDVTFSARSGRLRVMPWRLSAIESAVGSTVYSAYDLVYLDEYSLGEGGCSGEVVAENNDPTSVLKRVLRVSDNGFDTRELRCFETDESESAWEEDATFPAESFSSGAASAGGARAMQVNFDGDSFQDLLYLVTDCEVDDADDMAFWACNDVHLALSRGAPSSFTDEPAAEELALLTDVLTVGFLGPGFSQDEEGDAGYIEPGGYAMIDVDRNGTTDLLVGSQNGFADGEDASSGLVWSMQADLSTTSSVLDLGAHPGRLLRMAQWADVNGDGFVDLLLPANEVLDEDGTISALVGFSPGQSHWIPNTGSEPYFSADNLRALVVPFEEPSPADPGTPLLLAEDFSECEADPELPEVEAEPPAAYYGSRGLWQRTWAQWGDFNGDGIADVTYAVHACWNPVETAAPPVEYRESGLVAHTYYGDGQGTFVDSGYGPDTGFDPVTVAVSDDPTCITPITLSELRDPSGAPCLYPWAIVPREGTAVVSSGTGAVAEAGWLGRVNPCAGNSFAPDMHVLTPQGWRPIADVREGDRVWACDDSDGGACAWRRVQAVIVGDGKPVVELEVAYSDGTHDFVAATDNHPVAVSGLRWTDAGDLAPGEVLCSPTGADAVLVGTRPGTAPGAVYNLSVALAHTYFVSEDGAGDGVWVHNCPAWFRYMSRAEAEAVRSTGKLRGGRPGETFWTNRTYKTAGGAKRWNAHPDRPEVRMRFRLRGKPTMNKAGTPVEARFGESGGGREWSALDAVEVEVLGVDDLD